MKFERLFQEGAIGPLKLKNRGIMMPMATDMADKDGLPTPRQIAYYQERAKGGIAMIINEYANAPSAFWQVLRLQIYFQLLI